MKTQEYQEVDIKKLKYFKGNPRKITPEELEKLKRSISEFGFVEPVVIDEEYKLIGGHQRIKAARDLSYTAKIPAIVISGYSEIEKKALNIALNKLSGTWDITLLTDWLHNIKLEGLDFTLTGFTLPDLQDLNITFEDLDLKKLYSEANYDDLIDGTQGRQHRQIEDPADFCTCPTCGHRHKKE